MSASNSVLIVGIDADRCWYNVRYNLVVYDLLASYSELIKRYASMPVFTEEVEKRLIDFKTSMLNAVLEHKKVDIAEMDCKLREKYANWQRTKVIKPGMTQAGLKHAISMRMRDFVSDIKRVDAKTRHYEGFTIQFLIAAVANIPMINYVMNLKDSYDELKLVSTSSRLAPQIEREAMQQCPCGSIYQDIAELSKLLQIMLPCKRVSVNRYSPVDAILGIEPGTLFERCVESYWDDYKKPHTLEACVDRTKLTQFYGAIHSSMASDPSAQYQAVIFDDLTEIRDALESCMIKHGEGFTKIIPCNLIFSVYEGSVSSTLAVDGKGCYNPAYSETVTAVYKKNTRLPFRQSFDWLNLFLNNPSISKELTSTSKLLKDTARISFYGNETPKPNLEVSSSIQPDTPWQHPI